MCYNVVYGCCLLHSYCHRRTLSGGFFSPQIGDRMPNSPTMTKTVLIAINNSLDEISTQKRMLQQIQMIT